MKIHAGVDISDRWFDMCVLVENGPFHRQFENSSTGISACISWLESLAISDIEIAMEPTGRYGELVAERFVRRGYRVLQVQPLQFKRFAESLDMRIKSDSRDAHSLAIYCRDRGAKLREWRLKTDLEWELRDTQLLVRSLTKRTVVLQCQLKCRLRSTFVGAALQQELARCEEQLEEALEHAEQLVKAHPVLSRDFELLMSIPGIANRTALLLVTVIDFRKFRNSRSLACFLGLTLKKHESGASVRGGNGISKRGSKLIRGALFMPARSARIHNPFIRDFSERMLARGKHDWAIQMAVIRRLVTTSWSLVVHQVPFDRSYVNPHQST